MAHMGRCKGEGCPIKKKCYRYVYEGDESEQSFFRIPPYNKEKKECPHFWEIVKCKSCGKLNGVHKMDCDELRLRIHLY